MLVAFGSCLITCDCITVVMVLVCYFAFGVYLLLFGGCRFLDLTLCFGVIIIYLAGYLRMLLGGLVLDWLDALFWCCWLDADAIVRFWCLLVWFG